jgi:DNA-directed RNA polymerase subunit RPC12/RpoP
MTTKQKKSPPPNVPEIERCPRCGHHILIGDKRCQNCGRNLVSLEETIRTVNPMFVSVLGLAIGGMIAVAAIGMEGTGQLVMLLIGSGIVIGGGVFYSLRIIYDSSKRRRK